MALNNKDIKNRTGLRGVVNKHFGRDEKGYSYVSQVAGGVLNTFTLGDGMEIIKRSHYGVASKAITVSMAAAMTTGLVSFASSMSVEFYSQFIYDEAIPENYVAEVPLMSPENMDNGYITFDNGEIGDYMLMRAGDHYQLYDVDRTTNGDYTFTLTDDVASGLTALRIAHYYEEQQMNGATDESEIFELGAISYPYVDEDTGAVTISGDEFKASYSWDNNSELSGLWHNASDYFVASGNLQMVEEGPLPRFENILAPPIDREDDTLNAILFGLNLFASFAFGSSLASANRRSRKRYNKAQKNIYTP